MEARACTQQASCPSNQWSLLSSWGAGKCKYHSCVLCAVHSLVTCRCLLMKFTSCYFVCWNSVSTRWQSDMRHGQTCTIFSNSSRVTKGMRHMTQFKLWMLPWESRLLLSRISVPFLHCFFSAVSFFVELLTMCLLISFCFAVMSLFLVPSSPRSLVMGRTLVVD